MQNGKQMRFTTDELNLIKTTFGGNEALLKLLRKVFLPEITPDAPLGQVIDLWLTVDVSKLSTEDALRNLAARNMLIMHIEQQLIQLNSLGSLKAVEDSAVAGKNSAK